MTENEFRYWAFLSYSRQDNCVQRPDAQDVPYLCWGDWLFDALKTFSTPADFAGHPNARGEATPERIDPIFKDEQESPDDGNLNADIRAALEQSRCLVVICSPRSAKSLHVNEAVRYFKQLGRGNRILPIVIAGEPYAVDGSKPGISADEECFVPAMRHPLQPDGTLDTTRRAGRYIFADARHGVDKREISATDLRVAETELEIAKIQLIAGLIGVGFNGLWRREQKHRFSGFAEAQHQVREAEAKVLEAQTQAREAHRHLEDALNRAREAESRVQQVQNQALDAQRKLEEARVLGGDTRDKAVETQSVPQDMDIRIREAETKAVEAQNQARDARNQLEMIQAQARETQTQLDEARSQARVAEGKVEEARVQAGEAQKQLEEARSRAREAENKVLEIQNLSPDVRRQLEDAHAKVVEAQTQARDAQGHLEDARNQARDAQQRFLEAQSQAGDALTQAREAYGKVQELQEQLLESQRQLEAVRNQDRETQGRFEEARNQAQLAESKVQEWQTQFRDAQQQLELVRNQVVEAQVQLDEARNRAQLTENKFLAAQGQVRETQRQLEEAQSRTQEAQEKILEVQNQTRNVQQQIEEAKSQNGEDQKQVVELRTRVEASRRLTKVLAILAVLSLLSAGIIASIALWQRKVSKEALTKVTPEEVRQPDSSQRTLSPEEVRQALQRIDADADALAARIPTEEISKTLKASSAFPDGSQRSRFQKQLLIRLAATTAPSAMDCAGAIEGNIVNDEGAADTVVYFQLVVLEQWMRTDLAAAIGWVRQLPEGDARQRALQKMVPEMAADNPTNTLAVLNDLKPAPAAPIYALLFQRWATNDAVQAIQHRQEIPNHDAGDEILCAIVATWTDRQPDAALNWVTSQPDSVSKNKALETWILTEAKTDAAKSLPVAESLPQGPWRDRIIASVFNSWAAKDLDAAAAASGRLPAGSAKEKAEECILNQRIVKDPASVAEQVKNLEAGDYRQKAVLDLCDHWAETNAPAALTWAQSLSDAESVTAIDTVISHWAQKDPRAAAQFADQHSGLNGTVIGRIATAWSQSDFTGATNWILNLPEGEKKDAALLALAGATEKQSPELAAKYCGSVTNVPPKKELVQDITGSLARENFAGAVDWARGLKNDAAREAALSALSQSWAQNDPKGMATYAISLPSGDLQAALLTAACRQWAINDFPAMADVLKTLSDSKLRQSVLEQTAANCDLAHVNEASKYIAAMPGSDDRKAAVKGLLSRWASADPETALDWLCAFSKTNSEPEEVDAVIKSWSRSEPAVVAGWMSHLPADTVSEGMISAFLEGTVAKYPEFAAQWTKSVADDATRRRYQVLVARQWMKLDPAAAIKWIDSLGFPDDLKKSLETPLP